MKEWYKTQIQNIFGYILIILVQELNSVSEGIREIDQDKSTYVFEKLKKKSEYLRNEISKYNSEMKQKMITYMQNKHVDGNFRQNLMYYLNANISDGQKIWQKPPCVHFQNSSLSNEI